MASITRYHATAAAKNLIPFLSRIQLQVMAEATRGEEGKWFLERFVTLWQLIDTMPVTYAQDGKGDAAIVSLHYFLNDSHWYITEKDIDGGVLQAFGYAVLNGDDECAELGYISITELVQYGAELDLYFLPRPLANIKAERAGVTDEAEPHNPNPWVIVTHAGEDEESIWADYPKYSEAVANLKEPGEPAQIMKRLDSGVLTTEF